LLAAQKNSVDYNVDGFHAFVVEPSHDLAIFFGVMHCWPPPLVTAGEASRCHWLVGEQVYLTQQVFCGDDVMVGLPQLT